MNCAHCCFKNRKDRDAIQSLESWTEAIRQFHKLGTRALEFTGGGDPTMWPPLNEALEYAYNLDFYIGFITNGVDTKGIPWDLTDWVRVSLNTLDYRDDIDLSPLQGKDTQISFCYIWNERSFYHIAKVIDFANYYKIPCRIAPDCIKTAEEIEASVDLVSDVLDTFPMNEYVVLSDFNIDTHRRNYNCRIHMIKPCLYLDDWIYACPSAELAIENNRQVQPKTRVCRYNEVEEFYLSSDAFLPRVLDCSYCKYAKQQELLEDLLMETTFNEFA
jgi:hypothetical protein